MSCFFDSQCRWRRTIKSARINESANFPYAGVQRQGTAADAFLPAQRCFVATTVSVYVTNRNSTKLLHGSSWFLHGAFLTLRYKKIRVSQELRVATKLYLGAWEKIQDKGTVSVERE